MTEQQTMRMALEALEYHTAQTRPIYETNEAITALRQALEQESADEPVAWWHFNKGFDHCMTERLNEVAKQNPAPLYTRPQPAAWVSLTDEELKPLCDEWRILFGSWTYEFAKTIEAALRSKNT